MKRQLLISLIVVLLSFIIPAHAEFPFIVKDIHPAGDGLSDPVYLTPLYGAVFFRGADDRHGVELWKSDGTEAGTVLVKDINPEGDSWPGSLANINGTLYFSAMDEAYGWELWTSDGTEEGTTLLADINPKHGSSFPGSFTEVNGTLFFMAMMEHMDMNSGRQTERKRAQ